MRLGWGDREVRKVCMLLDRNYFGNGKKFWFSLEMENRVYVILCVGIGGGNVIEFY